MPAPSWADAGKARRVKKMERNERVILDIPLFDDGGTLQPTNRKGKKVRVLRKQDLVRPHATPRRWLQSPFARARGHWLRASRQASRRVGHKPHRRAIRHTVRPMQKRLRHKGRGGQMSP